MHKIRFFSLVFISAVLLASSFVIAGQVCLPDDVITLDASKQVKGVKKLERTAVQFPHADHFMYSCKKCHHTWDGTSPVSSCSAKGCHDQITTPEKPLEKGKLTDEALKYYKYAYHKQCKDCHLKINEENKKAEEAKADLPTGCNACHPKE